MANKTINSGEFHEHRGTGIRNDSYFSRHKTVEPIKPKLEFSDELISIYNEFKNKVYNPKSVLCPSCGFDASPSKVFSNVTFVDGEIGGNQRCIETMIREGLNAIKQDIRNYIPEEEHDLLILMNPCIHTDVAAKYLKKGGWIISNNYHSNAFQMHAKPEQYDFFGAFHAEKNQITITRDLEGYFEQVKNFEELKRVNPEEYEFLRDLTESIAKQCKISPKLSLDEKWIETKKSMASIEKMPFKRYANTDTYLFVKK